MTEAADSEEESAIDCVHSHTQACAREGARESIYGPAVITIVSDTNEVFGSRLPATVPQCPLI